jgi:hypothetical protein
VVARPPATGAVILREATLTRFANFIAIDIPVGKSRYAPASGTFRLEPFTVSDIQTRRSKGRCWPRNEPATREGCGVLMTE